MKIIKTWTALELNSEKEYISTYSYEERVLLSHGGSQMDLGIRKEFDSEDEAIEYAHRQNPYGEWLILPKIRFDNF